MCSSRYVGEDGGLVVAWRLLPVNRERERERERERALRDMNRKSLGKAQWSIMVHGDDYETDRRRVNGTERIVRANTYVIHVRASVTLVAEESAFNIADCQSVIR